MNRISIIISFIVLQIWIVQGLVQGDFHHDNTIREIIVRHEEALGHADRFRPDLKHNLPVPDMIEREGYKAESYLVVTEDCYHLEMHRIPFGKGQNATDKRRPAVYLQHGLLCSSADWVMGIPEKSLGYILADAGYDVWLGNYRGNTYSRGHCNLKPNDKAFWEFSWDEMGKYDIPAMIDKILKVTGETKIFYIGHSMGTTGFMVMANERPQYQELVHLANFLAPVAYVDHMKSPIRYLAPYINSVEWIVDFLGGGEFLPSNIIMDILADLVCDENVFQGLCQSVLFVLCGFDEAQLNKTLLETITHHTPAGTSTKTVVHYAQEINSKKFAHYDFGKHNMDHYGQDEPPEFSLKALTLPVASYWSQNDWLAQPDDVLRYLSAIPNSFSVYEVPFPLWNHLDYLWGIDADTLVYPEILKNLEAFRRKIS